MNSPTPTDDELHAFVDGRLPPEHRDRLQAWLRAHPQEAGRVQAWKRDAEALRAAWASDLDAAVPPALLADRLRRGMRRRQRARLGLAAACLLALGVGTLLGWQWRDARFDAEHPLMADAVSAYRLFAGEDIDMESTARPAVLQNWLRTHFGAAGEAPDLRAQGFHLQGGRLLSTPEGAAAMLVYQDAAGARIGLYLRPRPARLVPGERRDGSLLAQYWAEGDTAFALVGPAASTRLRLVVPLLKGG